MSELSSFALALIQADAIGSPIADVLQSNSARMRLIRRQVAREKAAKLPVKLLIPMMLFIFPALLIVIIGPAGLSIMEGLGRHLADNRIFTDNPRRPHWKPRSAC